MANQRIQIEVSCEYIAATLNDVGSERRIEHFKMAAERFKNLHGEKRDLTLVVRLVIKKAISNQSGTRHAIDLIEADNGMRLRLLPMFAKVIMAGRNADSLNDCMIAIQGHFEAILVILTAQDLYEGWRECGSNDGNVSSLTRA